MEVKKKTDDENPPGEHGCDHEWERAVETSGRTMRAFTKCKKCGVEMKPTKTVHHDFS